jgi:hypothetical protein
MGLALDQDRLDVIDKLLCKMSKKAKRRMRGYMSEGLGEANLAPCPLFWQEGYSSNALVWVRGREQCRQWDGVEWHNFF